MMISIRLAVGGLGKCACLELAFQAWQPGKLRALVFALLVQAKVKT
jgi:hypothetical protein